MRVWASPLILRYHGPRSFPIFDSFGLLHRIPPLPPDREPGSMPPELEEEYEGYEDQQLFVPADYHGDSEVSEQDLDEEELRWQQEEWMRRSYASASSYENLSANGNETISAYAGLADDTNERDAFSQVQDRHDDDTSHSGDDEHDTNDYDDGGNSINSSEEHSVASGPSEHLASADDLETTPKDIPMEDVPQPIPDASRNNQTIPQALDLRDTSPSPPPAPHENTIEHGVASTPVPVHVTPVRPAFSPFRVGSPRIGSPRPSTPTPRLSSFSFMNGDSSRPVWSVVPRSTTFV